MTTTAEPQDAEATAASTPGTGQAEDGAAPTADIRMWRKVVAFEWEQRDFLVAAADLLPGDDHGNVSAVIRAAVDAYAASPEIRAAVDAHMAQQQVPAAVPAQEG